MFLSKCTLFYILILTLLVNPLLGKRSFGGSHSYPKSGGLSGGGHRSGGLSGGSHGYPSSGGLSGGSHGYPSNSGGLSGGGHGYPSSGGSHSYPSSNNKPVGSGYPSSGGGSHSYPSSSQNHGYPSSGGGLSGGGQHYPANKPVAQHTTVHNHYHYSPPTQISYASPHGVSRSYPVYHGTPPSYVYQYKDSGSKYGTLVAGLALMNLGTLGVAAYAVHQANQNHGSGSSGHYKPQAGEVCKFAVKKENGDYEETRIECQIISSFILEDMESRRTANNSSVTTTTTVTNVTTIVNNTNMGTEHTTMPPVPSNILYNMLPNGTLVPVNVTGVNIPGVPGMVQNDTHNQTGSPGSSVVVTTTTTNTTLVSALDVKGKPVEVTPGMQCFVIRNSPISNMRKTVPCGLLQTYADRSLKPNSAAKHVPMFTLVGVLLAYCIA